jgi:hypothetical protein
MFPKKASVVSAYPLIISTLSEMDEEVLRRLKWIYNSRTPGLFNAKMNVILNETTANFVYKNIHPNLRRYFDPHDRQPNNPDILFKELADEDNVSKQHLYHMPQFNAQGFSLGTAFASQTSGDTVCTIFIGGMVTVMNGVLECKTGDLVQWYLPSEKNAFSTETTTGVVNGERIQVDVVNAPANNYFDERNYGMEGYNNNNHKSRAVFRVKPYRLFKKIAQGGPAPAGALVAIDEYTDHYGDKIRIFAKCIEGARPYEMMDLMFMTQSL